MAEQLIYKKLKSKIVQGLADDVKAYLASVNNPQTCADFIKTLFTYILRLQNGNASHEVHEEVLAAIEMGLQALPEVAPFADCSDHLLNALYHVFSLLIKQALFSQASAATRAALCLLKNMDCQSPKTAVVVSNMYVQLWNATLEIRQGKEQSRQAIGFELLLHAIRLLCLKDELSAVAERYSIIATWCATKVKNEQWLKELRQCIVTSVSAHLARMPAQLRASIPAIVNILLDQHKLSLWLGKCFSLVSEWKKIVSEALFAHEMGLYRHVTALLTIVDQVSAFGQCVAGRISSVPQVKLPAYIRWQDCRPGTEEFVCLASCVQTVLARLQAADQQIQGAANRQKFTAAFREMLGLAPFVKQLISHIHGVKAGLEHNLTALQILKLLLTQLVHLIQDTKDQREFMKTLVAGEDYCPSSLVELAAACAMETVDLGLLARPYYLLAYNCFQNKMSQQAITYAKISVEMTTLHMTHHPEDISAEAQSEFWKRCELLLWQFRQEKQYTEALHVIGKLVTLGVELRSLALVRWVKIRKEMGVMGEFQGSILKQLDTVGFPLHMTAEDKFGFLSFELNISVREGLPADACVELYYELKELASKVNKEFANTYVLVESTLLLSRFPYIDFNLDCSFDESFEKALTSVEALLKTSDKETADTARLLHAACLFWLYVNKIDTLRDFAAKDVAESAVDPSEIKCDDPILRQALAEDKDYSCDATRSYRHINVGYELSAQKDLDQVLELWCVAFQSPSSEWSLLFRDLVECWFFEHVKVVSEVFASSYKFLEEVKAVTLWYSVAKERGMNQETVLAASYLINVLLKVGLVDAAATVAEQTEAVAGQLVEGLPRLRFVLAQAHLLYNQEKFTEGFVLLEELLKHPLLQKNNKSSLLFIAEVKLLVCRYSLLPAAITGPLRAKGFLECDTPILLAQESLRMSQGVLHHFTDNITGEPCDPATMWMLERVLLDSAALLGQLYTGVGAAKEAYTFLKEYLRKAQVLVSATRCARLVLLIANLDLLCEKLHDAKRKLVSVEFMLHLGNFSCPKRSRDQEGSTMDSGNLECSAEIREKTCVKYPPPTARSHSMSVVLFLRRGTALQSPPSIPSLDKIHSANCDCELCQFYATRQLWIERDLLKCLLYVTVGDIAASVSGFESLLTLADSLQQKLHKEVTAVTSFLKHRLSKVMCFSFSKTTGAWAELLSLRANILLQLSEAHLLRKSYSSSLERADEGLKLVSLNGCGSKSQWKTFASLAHQKVKVLVTMSRKARDCSGNFKDSSLWLVNTNQHAAAATDEPTQSSPQRQHEKHSAALKAPNAPKPRRDTPMDRYVKSLSRVETASCADRGKEEKAAFVVYDETAESSVGGTKRSVARASKRGTTRTRAAAGAAAATAAAAGDSARSRHADGKPEVSRMPKKQVRTQRKTAKTDLVSTNAGEDTTAQGGGEDPVEQIQVHCSNGPPARLNTIDVEEATTSVARLSLREPAVQEDVLYMQEEDIVVTEEQLPACKPPAYDEMVALLNKAFQLIVHFPPCPLYAEMSRTMAHLLDLQEKRTKDSKDACLWHVSQTSAVTLQHIGLTCIYKKLKKQKAAFIRDGVQEWRLSEHDLSKAQALGFRMLSELKTAQLTELYTLLPADWTVVQVTAAEPITKGPSGVTLTPDLFVCQCRKGKAPITVKLSGSSDAEFHRVLFKEFNTILDESTATMKMTEPPVWWSVRHSLDKRMKDVVESMEDTWMGCWKGVFHGKIADPGAYKDLKDSAAQVVAKAAKYKLECCSSRLLEAVVDSAADLSSYQLSVAVCQLFGIHSSHPAHGVLRNLIQSKASLDFDIRRHPVILILDKAVQALPWESTPILLKNSVSRVPSINYLRAQLLHYHLMAENVYTQHVDTQKTYFILNPTSDIPRTQAQFEGTFTSLGWQGVIGKPPHKEEFQAALVGKDLIVYCGHGSGREYLVSDVIEQMHCHACPILMGCGSGRLKAFGPKIEPFGVVLQYWVGGSPCVVANLWDVTDKDIDRFTETFLKHWIPDLGSGDHIPDITTAVRLGRKSCKLQYLVGAAPVVYGLPVQSKKVRST